MSHESLNHSRWDCKYQVVFVPKYRKKKLDGKLRQFLGRVFHEVSGHKNCQILEGHMVQDPVHMLIAIPPKHAVAQVIGDIKGKSAIAVARQFKGRKQNFNGEKFGAGGYDVSVVMMFRWLDITKKRFANISSIKSNLKRARMKFLMILRTLMVASNLF